MLLITLTPSLNIDHVVGVLVAPYSMTDTKFVDGY